MAKQREILSHGNPQKSEGAPLLGEVPLLGGFMVVILYAKMIGFA